MHLWFLTPSSSGSLLSPLFSPPKGLENPRWWQTLINFRAASPENGGARRVGIRISRMECTHSPPKLCVSNRISRAREGLLHRETRRPTWPAVCSGTAAVPTHHTGICSKSVFHVSINPFIINKLLCPPSSFKGSSISQSGTYLLPQHHLHIVPLQIDQVWW